MNEPKKGYDKPLSLDLGFDEAIARFGQTDPKELSANPIGIKRLPAKMGAKELSTGQGNLDLRVDKQMEIQGVGMGVLNDGTAFLTQRGLARLVGIQNTHIGNISSEWDDPTKARTSAIKKLLEERGVFQEKPHIEVMDGGRILFAYPDTVCLAILEYYAFDAGINKKDDALKNFRLLAGKALQDFIYQQVGYDPTNAVPDAWRQFHDRVSLTYDAVPNGYFGIFKEIADMIVTLGQAGLHIDAKFVPDISVGQYWATHWCDSHFDEKYGKRIKFPHNYPEYFPQALSNPQYPWCYPESALGEFRKWFREQYIGKGKLLNYIDQKVKQKQLPASFSQLAIAAYSK